MRAGLKPANLASDKFSPSLSYALTDQTPQDRLDLDARRVRRRTHRRFRFADGHGVVDCETQTNIVNRCAWLELAAEAILLDKGFCIDKPCLDFPEPVAPQVAIAFDRSLMHRPTVCSVTFIFWMHHVVHAQIVRCSCCIKMRSLK